MAAPLGDLDGSCLQTTECREVPKVVGRVAVGVVGIVANSQQAVAATAGEMSAVGR